MDQRWARRLQTVSLTMFAWFAYSWLTKLHWSLGAALCVFAFANVATVWMLREKWGVLQAVVRVPLARRYIHFVCSCTGEQLPSCPASRALEPRILLRSKRDFEVAADRARQVVRGHDEVIQRMLVRIHENQTLRKRQRSGSRQGPLASFLLVGLDGVGKRYLSRVLAKLLYRDGTIDVFECDQLSAAQLTGTKGSAGELEPVRKDPHRILLFEQVDRAPPEMIRLFMRLLTSGKLRLSGTERNVSFENNIVMFTTTLAVEGLSELVEREPGEAVRDQKAMELVANATGIDNTFLHAVTEVMYTAAPDDAVKSEVIALLLAKECRAHRTELTHVDPEIIATQVLQIDDAQGFAGAPQLVKKLLRKPLVAATEGDHPSLSLRVRTSIASMN